MTVHYYLGANTPEGFASLYDRYVAGDDRLYIIKGSPGSGKSTFMKSLARELISLGANAELIHCSGDPESLDGVYFPELHTAYVDGTAPHVIEPVYAGVSGNYLNFGAGLDMDGLSSCRGAITEYTAKYREQYVRAYNALRAARVATDGIYDDPAAVETVKKRALTLAAGLFDAKGGTGTVKERFTDALTCRGWVHRYDTVAELTDTVYLVDTGLGLHRLFVKTAAEYAVGHGWDVILCRDALMAAETAHLIVPEAGVAIVSRYGDELPQWNARAVRLDAIQREKADTERIRTRKGIFDTLIGEAIGCLERAKLYHDKLETVYRPYVDFSFADALMREHVQMLKAKMN